MRERVTQNLLGKRALNGPSQDQRAPPTRIERTLWVRSVATPGHTSHGARHTCGGLTYSNTPTTDRGIITPAGVSLSAQPRVPQTVRATATDNKQRQRQRQHRQTKDKRKNKEPRTNTFSSMQHGALHTCGWFGEGKLHLNAAAQDNEHNTVDTHTHTNTHARPPTHQHSHKP